MSIFDQAFVVPLAMFIVGVAVTLIALRVRSRRRAPRRRVESPNSHYTSQLARESVALQRWRAMALDRVHEINREEVQRLLSKVEATSVEALSGRERAFLDYMAELADRPARAPSPRTRPLQPQLRPG